MEYLKEFIEANQMGVGITYGVGICLLFLVNMTLLSKWIKGEGLRRTEYWAGYLSLAKGARLPRSYLAESALSLAWFRGRLDAISDQALSRKQAHTLGMDKHGHVPARMSTEEAFCDLLAGLPGGSPSDLRVAAERAK